MLTLIVNATTTKYLLAALGMSDISHATRVTMAQGRPPHSLGKCTWVAFSYFFLLLLVFFFIFCLVSLSLSLSLSLAVRRVREAKQRAISMLKSDHFLADANWEIVENTTEIRDPYRHLTESVHVSSSLLLSPFLFSKFFFLCPSFLFHPYHNS